MMGHFPKRFYIWCLIRTIFQVAISFYALDFVINSNFFHPSGYQSDAWNKEHLRVMYLPQAVFELLDLLMELWMLRKENSKAHLPWDSIIHHGVSGMYALYIYVYADSLSHEFLGLAVAALSCQVIGPLYTIYRMKFRFKYLGLVILAVQLLYRCPLALVSCLRAYEYFDHCPWAHFGICFVLANLDYRWTLWSYNLHKRLTKNINGENDVIKQGLKTL